MKLLSIVTVVLSIVFFQGCSQEVYVEPDVDFSHVHPQPRAALTENFQAGSIYQSGYKMNLFGNSRSWKIGDLITVTVNETASVDTKASNTSGRKANSTVAPPTILGMIPNAGEVKLDMTLSTDNNYEGEYEQKQTQKITFQITATVAHIFPNGNLLIKGEKEFFSNGTREFMCLRGIARPDDIFADNTILANRLGDLTIQMGQNGQLSKGAQAGWLTKIISLIYPF